MKKRVLSIFMVVALLLTLLPTTALAYRDSDSLGYKLFSGWNTRHTQMIAETDTAILNGTVVKIGNTTLTRNSSSSTVKAAKESGISITPPAGYYVAEVIIACNDNGGFNCNTAAASNLITFGATSYESTTFHITPDELNQGAEAGKTVWHDGRGKPYWIMVRIVKSPDPVHVIYDAGEMKSVIGASTVLVTGGNDIAVDNSAGTASHAVLDMKDDYKTVTSGGKTYRFTGWKLEYYTTYQNGELSVFNSNSGIVQPRETIKLHLHAKLIAQWEEVTTYHVYYNANGGTGTMTDTKEYVTGDAITVKENTFTYDHKHFVKFTLDAAGTQEIPADFKMGEEDITLYAQWEDDPTYRVYYNANGGTGTMTDAKEYYTGDAITVKANEFTYEHKHFVKFTLDAAGTQEIPADFKMGEEDITLYAQWEDDPTYRVYYNANGGTGTMTDATEYYTGDAIAVKANEFTYAHKYFVKFTLDAAGTQEIPADFKMGEEDITLYAQWEGEPSYHVFYDANGGTGTMTDATEYYTDDPIIVLKNVFTREGYTFVKFTLDAAGTQEIPDGFKMGQADITLYAQWEKVKEETPEVPVSGESSHVGMYLCVMLAAAAGAVWMLVLKRKFQQQ